MAVARSVTVRLGLDVSQYISGAQKAAQATTKISEELGKVGQQKLDDAGVKGVGDEADKAAPKVKSLGGELRDAASSASFDKVANSMIGLGTVLGGIGVAAVKSFADFDQEMSHVSATGDDARQNMTALREAALQAGADTKFSATEAAAGITELAKAGMSAKDILGSNGDNGGLTGALNLAASGNLDVAKSAELMASTMAQFNLEGDKASHVADLLAAGANEAVGDVSDLGYALKMSGTVASQYGISIEDTTTTLALFAKNALLGSDGGTSFKQMLLQLASPTKQQARVMDELGLKFYDANGRFIGMRETTALLADKMKNLSQESQNAALKTLFGADAIRAANILVKEGVDGYDKMNLALQRDGYAKQLAAEKTNNLAGDLERLKGSVETALIKAGEGANGPLRSLVEGLEKSVNWASQLPAPIQQAGVMIAGFGGAAMVGVGGLMKLATTAAETMDAVAKLREEAPRLSGAMEGIGKAALALGAVGAVISVINTSSAEMERSGVQGLQAFREQLQGLGKDAQFSAPMLAEVFHNRDGQQIVRGVDDLGTAFRRLNHTLGDGMDWWDKMDDALLNATGPMFGAESGAKRLENQFRSMDQALASMPAGQAATAFTEIAKSAEASHVPVDQLVKLFPAYRDQLQKIATDHGVTVDSARVLADWMGGKIPPAVQAAVAAHQTMATAADTVRNAVEKEESAFGSLTIAQYKHAQAAIALSGTEIGYQSAIDAATKSVQQHGVSLDINTESGRANRQSLDQLATSALMLMQKHTEMGMSTSDVAAKQRAAGEEFMAAAQRMGMSSDAARKLADDYGLIPHDIVTNINTNADLSGARAVRAELEALNGFTSYSYIVTQHIDSGAAIQGSTYAHAKMADGGIIEYYASGGVRESHVAQIAPANTLRVWAEPETGGEAYIPLAMSKRSRSLDIFKTVGKIFGYEMFADGGIRTSQAIPAQAVRGGGVTVNVYNPLPEKTSDTVRAASTNINAVGGF